MPTPKTVDAHVKRSDFHYHLPEDLIAQVPLPDRTASRLLQVTPGQPGKLVDRRFADLPGLLRPHDLLVFNNTRVIPARLFGQKPTGGKVEIMIERLLSDRQCLAMLRVSKTPRAGGTIELEDGSVLRVIGREDSFFILELEQGALSDKLDTLGHMPLPPYIQRQDTEADRERYQTVYARNPGAVAAPTAGLHFNSNIINKIQEGGVNTAEVTLHVGAGTFQPVRVDNIEDHQMHAEYLEVSQDVCDAVRTARENDGRVIAVGTTAVRSLETAAADGELKPYAGDSSIFIYPGFRFRAIDGLLTNFHLPESTLLMLVSALAGTREIRQAYQHAVQQRYRFFSYGDAMLIL